MYNISKNVNNVSISVKLSGPINEKINLKINNINYTVGNGEVLNLYDERVYYTNVGGNAETWHYGHSEPSDDGSTYVVIADPDGLRQLIKRYGRNRIFAVYIDVDDGVRKARCVQRKDFDETEWSRRLADDTKVFADIDKYVNLTVKNHYLP